MKILVFGVASPDYMQDDLYHGLKSIYGQDVEANVNLAYLYSDFGGDISRLYGRGMSYAKNLDPTLRVVVKHSDILEKITSKYYDAIIYLSSRRCLTDFHVISKMINCSRIVLVDGEDDCIINPMVGCNNFKRELLDGIPDIFPISFAIPAEKLCLDDPIKLRNLSVQIPTNRNYQFNTESEYYAEYQGSQYAITCKKAGWDCKRHYEILANRCVPIFENLDACPQNTMTTLPKDLLKEIRQSYQSATLSQYQIWQQWLVDYTKNNLTTVHLANYVMDKLV